MKLRLSPLAIIFVLVGTVLVWALCGDNAQVDGYSYTPGNQDPGQVYSFTRYFTVYWTNGAQRSIYLQSNGRWNFNIPPTACNPQYDYGWETNTNRTGHWTVNAQAKTADVSGCSFTGATSFNEATINCSGGGTGCRPKNMTLEEAAQRGLSPETCSYCEPEQWEIDLCNNGYDYDYCQCYASPVLIDVLGNGYNLTNAANGVNFDISGNGIVDKFSWTSAGSDDAWLALDRNSNGTIDSGTELFGNFTNQPTPPQGEEKNGFLALAEYDKANNGGNGDGFITKKDSVFDRLRLWQDVNHNGISEATELFTLPQLGLRKMDLEYQESKRTDEYGNKFRFRAKVKDGQDAQLGRWAWDVYLLKQH